MVGQDVGPLAVGMINDALKLDFGADAVRYSLPFGRLRNHTRRAAVRLGSGVRPPGYQAGRMTAAQDGGPGAPGGLTSRQLLSPAKTRTKPFCGTHETILKQSRDNRVCNKAALADAQGAFMNHSIHSADRATHLKIVAVALVAGLAIAGFGISARSTSDYAQTAHVIKAGKTMAVSDSDMVVVR